MTKRLRYTVEQALSQDPNKLTEKELRAAVQALADASQKRIKRAKEKGVEIPPALQNVMTSGKISTRGKNIQQLRKEYARASRQFGSVSGGLATYNKYQKQVRDTLKNTRGIDISKEEWDRFWRTYENLKAKDPRVGAGRMKYQVLEEIASISKKEVDIEAITNDLESRLEEIYQASMELEEVEDEYGDLPF